MRRGRPLQSRARAIVLARARSTDRCVERVVRIYDFARERLEGGDEAWLPLFSTVRGFLMEQVRRE